MNDKEINLFINQQDRFSQRRVVRMGIECKLECLYKGCKLEDNLPDKNQTYLVCPIYSLYSTKLLLKNTTR
jgi:hypothetical protein